MRLTFQQLTPVGTNTKQSTESFKFTALQLELLDFKVDRHNRGGCLPCGDVVFLKIPDFTVQPWETQAVSDISDNHVTCISLRVRGW